jgi:hypothetical protein
MYYTLIIPIILILLIILQKIWNINSKNQTLDNIVMTLYRQTARWALASVQDQSEIIKVLHANYATGYLWAIKDIVSTQDFERITGENFLQFQNKIVAIQDEATKKLVNICKPLMFIDDKTLFRAMYST